MAYKDYNDRNDTMVLYVIVSSNRYVSNTNNLSGNSYDKLYREYKKDKEMNKDSVKAWTDKKALAKFYLEFHKCKNFKTIQVDSTMGNLSEILDGCIHDEIQIMNIRIKDPEKPYKEKILQIPMTQSELDVIVDQEKMWSSSMIDYGVLEKYYYKLKNKYKKIFDGIFLTDLIMNIQHGEESKYLKKIKQDQLALMYLLFEDSFN